MFVAYGLMLLVSVVHGMISGPGNIFIPDASVSPEAACWRMAACEAIDTAIVLGCWWYIGRLPVLPRPSRASRMSAWIAAVPVLGLTLAANRGYHMVLQDIIRFPIHYVGMVDASPHLWVRWLLVVCVQPAIVEELFFRGLAFRVLLPHLSGGGTVMITAIAFGLAHIHAPLSVPILVGLGVVNGCAALMTGRLWLPILLHFAHNLAVTLLGWYL
ncbi:MAG TPA: CPBP family intramembrane glutamic endopeptidase [Pirellulales bacterium]